MAEREKSSIGKDIKTSLILAKRNILSFILAMLGLSVLLIVAIVAVALPLGLTIGYVGGSSAELTWASPSLWIIVILGMSIAILIFTLFLFVFGGIYGMAMEIIEEGKSHAEKPFSTMKQRFVPIFISSLLITLILLGIPLVIGGAISVAYGGNLPQPIQWIQGIILLAWIFIIGGLLSTVFPCIADGKGVKEAFSGSFKKAKNQPGRIFSAMAIFLAIWIVPWLSIVLWGIFSANDASGIWIAIYAPLLCVFLIFFILPAQILTFTRIYSDLEGKKLVEV